MALKPCRECGAEISTLAKTCPHCGVSSPAINIKAVVAGGALLAFLLLFIVVLAASSGGSRGDRIVPSPTCRNDWMKCANNADMAKHYRGWWDVRHACEREAKDRAKYGNPDFPWESFPNFMRGDNYVKSGKAILMENDAQFSNGFGAMVHVNITCEYDLRTKSVLSVSIRAR
jgi:hypothetical protein